MASSPPPTPPRAEIPPVDNTFPAPVRSRLFESARERRADHQLFTRPVLWPRLKKKKKWQSRLGLKFTINYSRVVRRSVGHRVSQSPGRRRVSGEWAKKKWLHSEITLSPVRLGSQLGDRKRQQQHVNPLGPRVTRRVSSGIC